MNQAPAALGSGLAGSADYRRRLPGPRRRAQILRTASALFAQSGLQGTRTCALAKAAGISEPVLYAHFGSKELLFREAVKFNVQSRLRALDERLSSIARGGNPDRAARLAEAAILACLEGEGNALLTSWALLEDPEKTAELHRQEIASAGLIWEREFLAKTPGPPPPEPPRPAGAPFAIQACFTFGFRLASLRHTGESAAALVREFAAGVAQAVAALPSSSLDQAGAAARMRTGAGGV